MRELLYTAEFFLSEFAHGCVLFILIQLTVNKIFGQDMKRSRLLPAVCGAILAISSCLYYLMCSQIILRPCLLIAVIPTMILYWFFCTERKISDTIYIFLAMSLSDAIIYSIGNIILTLTANFMSNKLMDTVTFINYNIIFFISLLYIMLLCKLMGSSVKEPLSLTDASVVSGLVILITLSSSDGYDLQNKPENAEISQVFITSFILLCTTLIVVLTVKRNQNRYLEKINRLNEDYLNMQSRHFEMMRRNDTSIRKLNHDIRNHVFCLNELYRQERFHELGEYLSRMSDAVKEAQPAVRTDNSIADAIITEKKAAAERFGIGMTVSGSFGTIAVSAYDLCTILANLLDNAVEAASCDGVRHRWIEVSCKSSGNFTVLSIRNTTAEPVDVSSPVRTVKSDKTAHGFGLGNVRSAIERIGGDFVLNCEPYESEYVFTAEVFFPNNQNLRS